MNNYGLFTKLIILIICISMVLIGLPSKASDSLYITGKVISSSSRIPVSSIWVEVYKNDARIGRSLTGNDGKYFIGNLDRGSYDIVIKRGEQVLLRRSINLPADAKCDIDI